MTDSLDLAVTDIAEAHHGNFSASHLRDLRVSDAERKYRLSSGRWTAPHERVYRIAGAPRSWRGDLLAACWAGGTRAVASHRSAAAIWGLTGGRENLVEITCPRWRRAQHDGLIVHESRALSTRDVTAVDNIPVTTVERTLFDMLAVCSRRTVDYAIDNALRRELTTLDELAAMLRRVGRRGLKGTTLLRGLLAERDAQYTPTESERESMMIDAIRSHGLAEPVRQFVVRDEHGVFVGRVDLAYPELMITIEYDSYQEHVGKQALVRDSRRRNAIAALGYCTLVATAEDVRFGQGHALASAIKRARAPGERAPDPPHHRTGVKVGG